MESSIPFWNQGKFEVLAPDFYCSYYISHVVHTTHSCGPRPICMVVTLAFRWGMNADLLWAPHSSSIIIPYPPSAMELIWGKSNRIQLFGGGHCSIAGEAAACDASIPHGHWLESRMLHSCPTSPPMAWKSSRR